MSLKSGFESYSAPGSSRVHPVVRIHHQVVLVLCIPLYSVRDELIIVLPATPSPTNACRIAVASCSRTADLRLRVRVG